MVNKLTVAIAIALDAAFGEECTVYSEDVLQNLEEPCFHIENISTSQRRLVARRYDCRNPFDIQYFPRAGDHQKAEINAVYEVMKDKLEYVTTIDGGLFYGIHMSGETIDGVGHFFVDYNFIGIKPAPEEPLMEALNMQTNMKE